MCAEDLYGPLGMKDSHMGVRPDMQARRVPIQALDSGGAPFPIEFLEAFNMPENSGRCCSGGRFLFDVFDLAPFLSDVASTAAPSMAFVFLSPALVDLATTIHTGDMEDRCRTKYVSYKVGRESRRIGASGSGCVEPAFSRPTLAHWLPRVRLDTLALAASWRGPIPRGN